MKTVSDDLFRLIKSLTAPEKGYFRKFASRSTSGTKQNYLVLFDAIESMDEYDEGLLKKKLKNESFFKQIAVYKVYLFNLILKSLSQYGAYDNSEARLTEMLINIRTLEGKHLYREALKILRKAKVIAYKYDRIRFLQEILSIERHIIILMPDKKSLEKRKSIYKEQKKYLETISNFYEYSWLCDQMTILVDHFAGYRTPEAGRKIDILIKDPRLSSEDKPKGYYAKMNFYHTHLTYSGAKEDNDGIFYYLKKEIEHAENNKHVIDDNPQNYVFALINFLLYSSYINKTGDAARTIEKIDSLRERLKSRIPLETEIQIFFHAVNAEMLIYEKQCEMDKGRNKAREVEKEIKKYRGEIPAHTKALLLVNLSCFWFLDENYTASLKFLNLVLNDPQLNLRNDAFEFAKIFSLVLHFELRNFDLLEYLTESAKKQLRTRKNASKIEHILVNFFKDVLKAGPEEERSMFDELLFRLKNARKEKGSSSMMEYFDFISWAEGRISGMTLVEVKRSKIHNTHASG